LIAEIADELPALRMSFAVLGTGDARYQKLWQDLERKFPHKFGVKIGFDEQLAHLVEGAADMFLMPSRFEPCGLNQMYSMRYGTVPVVRATGGLDDTVTDYNEKTGTGTGFKFSEYTPAALLDAIGRARAAFANPGIWKRLQLAGMRQDFSWDRSAGEYVKLYERALSSRSRKGSGLKA
jgi:starch synthase